MTGQLKRSASLVEIVIAAGLFAVVMLGIASMVISVGRSNAFSNEQAAAMAAAAEKLEELKVLDATTLFTNHNGETFDVTRTVDNKAITLDVNPAANRAKPGLVTIEPIGNGNFVRVRIQVDWLSTNGTGNFELTWGRGKQ